MHGGRYFRFPYWISPRPAFLKWIYLWVIEGDVHGGVRRELEHGGLGVDSRSARTRIESGVGQGKVPRRSRIHRRRRVGPRRRTARTASRGGGRRLAERTVHAFFIIIFINPYVAQPQSLVFYERNLSFLHCVYLLGYTYCLRVLLYF